MKTSYNVLTIAMAMNRSSKPNDLIMMARVQNRMSTVIHEITRHTIQTATIAVECEGDKGAIGTEANASFARLCGRESINVILKT